MVMAAVLTGRRLHLAKYRLNVLPRVRQGGGRLVDRASSMGGGEERRVASEDWVVDSVDRRYTWQILLVDIVKLAGLSLARLSLSL